MDHTSPKQVEIIIELKVGNNKTSIISDTSEDDYIRGLFDGLTINKQTNNKYKIRLIKHKVKDWQGTDIIPVEHKNAGHGSSCRILDSQCMFGLESLLVKDNNYDEKRGHDRYPIIHWSVCDFMNDDVKQYITGLPRYVKVLDSSIWNYFYSLEYQLKYDEQRKCLAKIVDNIIDNYDNGIYDLAIAHEYADFNTRMVRESFIADTKLHGHGRYVSPYIFHSEREMYRKAQEKLNKLGIHPHAKKLGQWRILLVDDKTGDNKLSWAFMGQQNRPEITKEDIIVDRLKLLCGEKIITRKAREKNISNNNQDSAICIETVSSIEEAKKALQEKQYEIVLLDYLLDKDGGEQHYGHELLEVIQKDYNNGKRDYKYGPHKKIFFMFISAFTTAVHERLLAEGYHHSEPYWQIDEGACPTNTPYLFLYNLFCIMEQRLLDSGIYNLEPSAILRLIEPIFNASNVRQAANERFDEVLRLLYHYKGLLQDVCYNKSEDIYNTPGSVLATKYLADKPYLGALLEHLTHLVYLTAFGTIRQWPEMWDEYHYIRMCLYSINQDKDFHKIFQQIEKHILNLKTGNL